MFFLTSRAAKTRPFTRLATRAEGPGEARAYTRVLLILAALIATGAFASRLLAQPDGKLYHSVCGVGFIEPCGEEIAYSDCSWHWKGYSAPMFPYFSVTAWYACETQSHKVLYKNYFKPSWEQELM